MLNIIFLGTHPHFETNNQNVRHSYPLSLQIVYLAPDKLGRPILLYRAACHIPNVQDPYEYTRYILYQTEKTRMRTGLGKDCQACVIVDRIGSGVKNQDPALLKVPCHCLGSFPVP
jgi:hypothetical protein